MSTARKRKRETRPKTKTFTGCWTCRTRKVKCDAGRPSCTRCGKSGLQCEGYNVKLYWITGEDTVAPSAIKRQAMTLIGYRGWPFQLDEVDRQIADVEAYDNLDLEDKSFSTGPFSVFRWQYLPPSTTSRPQPSLCIAPKSEGDIIQHVYDSPESENFTSYDFSDADGWSSLGSPARLITQFPASSPDMLASPLLTSPSSAIFEDPIIDRLMKNYVLNVANVLPPLPHPESAYASIYVPNAMVGAANLIFGLCETSSDLPLSNVAVFYALLATSAFQLRGTEGRNDSGFDLLARSFRAKAFASLQKALEEPPLPNANYALSSAIATPASHFETMISAMLAFSSMDVMEGSMSEYWIHLEGVERLARQLRSEGRASPLIDRLITNSSFLSTLANTTSIGLAPVPWSEDSIDLPEPSDSQSRGQHGLEVTYGITTSLAVLMRQIVVRSQNISFYVSNGIPLPPSLISACNDLSDAISQWSVDSEPLSELFSHDTEADADTTLLLAKNHVLAFCHGLRVYYHTRILPCTPFEMSHYVELVAQHLIAMEEIKAKAGFDSNVAATIMWPGFIAACEAQMGHERDIWYRWWEGMLRHRIGNISQLWNVVQQAWALRDEEGLTEVPGWMPVLRRTGKRVLAI